ncbi:ABC transporter permease [Roseivirga misakiensis]|uniref:Uncharacterized protein n=1 Tax=Roseivirga misakiensis TaxID=1563681 RepID=A0A1E5SK95_9BACT|nr:ABC transporter permease [Roseivirga misakiensis]OEJ99545.1 hypothetical protein BFP71_08175 [Roseivirga misakiensis]
MNRKRQEPSRFFRLLFEKFCKEELFEELQGDLQEEFKMNSAKHGLSKARQLYRKEVLQMIRPSVLKSKKRSRNSFQPTIMFKNYSVVALRNILRNKLFSSINIVGLSISMAVGLIAITFVSEIYSYDDFHQKRDNIYRVVSDITRPARGTSNYATTPLIANERLTTDFPNVATLVPVDRGMRGNLIYNQESYAVKGISTSSAFFEIFTFPMIQGNAETALNNPYTAVITESTALKIFGKVDALGQFIEHSRYGKITITGVVKDPPHNSHLQFDIIGSIETLRAQKSRLLTRWSQSTASYLYVYIPESQSKENFLANLSELSAQENEKVNNFEIELQLEALNDIFPGDGRYNQFGTVMPQKNVNSIIILALIVLLSACFNYTNLSMARSLKRAKEVGVRKVIGASRTQLLAQFILEAIFISTFALLISVFLFRLIRPEFLALNFYIERTTTLLLSPKIYLFFFLFALLIGGVSGFLPALVMSKLKPVSVIKGVASIKASKGLDVRKVLTTIQFTLSMGFFVLVTLVYKQYKYALNFDLGFTTENVLNVDIKGEDIEVLRNTFSKIPEVVDLSSSAMIPSTGSYQSFTAKYDNPQDSVSINMIDISPGYIENMGHQLLAGSSFDALNIDHIILNDLAVKRFGINSPQEAIGETISFGRKTWTVIGVVATFHDRSIDKPLAPFAFTSGINNHYYLNLKLQSADMIGTMQRLSETWDDVSGNSDFEARFYSDYIEMTYSDISASVKTYGLLAIIAISISVLGLLGMAVYTTESKVKELAIRKVLGADLSSLLALLSKNFMVIFIISGIIAIPTAYMMFNRVIVPDMVYTIDVGFWELAGGALLIILIAFLTISSQTLKAAKTNPAHSLRND